MHFIVPRAAPEGMTHSGLHTVDTYMFVQAMANLERGFHSPYALCSDPHAPDSVRYYALPHAWFYGALGMLARLIGADPFLFLGFAQGAALAFYLWAALRFYLTALSGSGPLAFLFFSVAGGLGGIAFVLSGFLGLHGHPDFPAHFLRFAFYELIEGQRFHPWLLAARLYYTVPLGLGLMGLAALVRAASAGEQRLPWHAVAALALGAWLNFRVGPMLWAGGMLYLACARGVPPASRRALALRYTAPSAAGVAAALAMLQLNPGLPASVAGIADRAMWFSPFLIAAFWSLLAAPIALRRALPAAPWPMRALGFALSGFLLAFAALYLAYQLYYGNLLRGADATVAIRMSDWAALGAAPGALAALWPRRPPMEEDARMSWLAIWFLGAAALSIAAFGQGAFLLLSPERFMVVITLPLAALAGESMWRLRRRRPMAARAITGLAIGSGALSIVLAWGWFHGPLGAGTVRQQFPWTDYSYISKNDARMLDAVSGGVVLAPADGWPLLGDVAALRPGVRTVYGLGTLDFSSEHAPTLREAVRKFYGPETPNEVRWEQIEAWCADYVLVPEADPPVSAETRAALHAHPGLEVAAEAGGAALFRVMR